MFNIFKKKQPEKPFTGLLPVQVDMHSHILPGIDDGAPDLDTALLLVRGLYDLGIRTCIATPHVIGDMYRNTDSTIEDALQQLRNGCRSAAIDMNIRAAAEYMMDDYFMELLRDKVPLRTLKDNLLLTEITYTSEPIRLQEMVFNIITEGYKPVLAHPERYHYYHRNYEIYRKLKDLGFLLQVNMLSLTGYYGKEVAKAARYIYDNGLADLVGTDLHHDRHLLALQSESNHRLFNKYLNNKKLLNSTLV